MEKTTIHRNDGMALVAATIFILVIAMTMGALSMRVISQNHQVQNYATFQKCFTGLEAAQDRCVVELEQANSGLVGVEDWTPPNNGTDLVLPAFDEDGVEPLSMVTMPSVEYFAYPVNWMTDGRDNNGDGTIDGIDENYYYTVYSFARNQSITRRSEAVMAGADVNVWRNAIFAGAGQAGGLINGNVSIHGSVHLLGENLVTGTEAITAVDLSGTSLIHNNYEGCPADLLARVPALPQRTFDGELVGTLGAKLRVKNGLVSLSGNSEVGQPHQTGNSFKETMDGTYVTDGWTGNAVIDDGDRGDPTSVFSDNGWDDVYDLGSRVQLPLLSHDYREIYTGTRYMNPNTGTYYTHIEYFNEQMGGTPYNGDLTIKANQDFYYNATRPNDPNPANRQPGDHYLLFNAATNVLEMNGQIEVNGNLTITRGSGNDKTVHYTGRAALLVHGNVNLETDLLSRNADGSTANSFPQNNILGIMATNDMYVGTLAQLKLMGAFYAQGTVKSTKQTITMGTFVGNYFDMGTNVPEIYQVPALADFLPNGMIGAYPILTLEQISWRELG